MEVGVKFPSRGSLEDGERDGLDAPPISLWKVPERRTAEPTPKTRPRTPLIAASSDAEGFSESQRQTTSWGASEGGLKGGQPGVFPKFQEPPLTP